LNVKSPSNLTVVALVVVTLVLIWFAWLSMHPHRSADQRILIQKSKQ
jgi:hypothetical protein